MTTENDEFNEGYMICTGCNRIGGWSDPSIRAEVDGAVCGECHQGYLESLTERLDDPSPYKISPNEAGIYEKR